MSKVGIISGKAGTGKTTVANILRGLGLEVIDADSVAHKLLDEFKNEVIREFGEGILDANGQIDRKKLGSIVFQDPNKMAKLEQILHPLLKKRISEMIEERKSDIFIDVAIPKKLHLYPVADFTIIITAPLDLVVERLKNKGWPDEKIEAILNWQAEEVPEGRYYLVTNTGTLEELKEKIVSILKMEGIQYEKN